MAPPLRGGVPSRRSNKEAPMSTNRLTVIAMGIAGVILIVIAIVYFAEPAKSLRRKSPEPCVVRYAAFVTPMPSRSSSNCSAGS